MKVSHEFGGQHTDLKLSVIEKYLSGYTTALRSQFSQLWYIDAFAGTGSRTVRTVTAGNDLLETPVIERVDDAGHPVTQARRRVRRAEDVSPPLGGVAQYRCPKAVGITELVLHGAPGGAGVLRDPIGRHRAGLTGCERGQSCFEQALAGGRTPPVRPSSRTVRFGHTESLTQIH